MRVLLALLPLLWLVGCMGVVVEAEELPSSYVLLPLSYLPANISNRYACTSTYSSTPCSGHGTCYLLVDSLNSSASYSYYLSSSSLPSSSALPVSVSNLDTHSLSSSTPLPLAVCMCDTGWTGRGDYINHLATDGDSCAIQLSVMEGLSATATVLFTVLLLMALRRLQLWHQWYAASLHNGTTGIGTEQSTDSAAIDAISSTSNHILNTTAAGRVRLLRQHMRVIFFMHPLSTALSCVLLVAWFSLRYRGHTLGISWPLSAVVYAANQPIMVTFCLSVSNTIKLAAAITRRHTGAVGLSRTMRVVKRCMIGIVCYNGLVWLLLFLLPTRPASEQQFLAQLVLTVCYSPVWLLSVVSLLATRRVTAALLDNLDLLSTEQQQARRKVWQKLSRQSYIAAVLLSINSSVCLMLASSATLRQKGFPYFALAFYMSGFFSFAMRLLMLHPPKITMKRRSGTVAPAQAQSHTIGLAGKGGAGAKEGETGGVAIKWLFGKQQAVVAAEGSAGVDTIIKAAPLTGTTSEASSQLSGEPPSPLQPPDSQQSTARQEAPADHAARESTTVVEDSLYQTMAVPVAAAVQDASAEGSTGVTAAG